jgi:Zn-dependent protease
MSTGSIRLGTYAGIPVRAHWSMALVVVLFGVNLAAQLGTVPGLVATALFFVSILLHEFGHALVARRHGVETESIDLWALGGVARLDREPPTPRADALIALAGPSVSLVIGAVALTAGVAMRSPMLTWIGLVNMILALFNMLPGAPLDGGRVLRAYRWWRTGNRYRAMRDAGNAGRLLGWSIAGIGGALMLHGHLGVFVLITGVFIAMSARTEIMSSYIGERLDGVKVRDLVSFGVAQAGADMDTDSMIAQRQRLGNVGAVAVVDDDGNLDGLVLEEQLWAVPDERRPLVMLTQLMVPFGSLASATLDEDLASVLTRLDPRHPVVTVWNGDTLLGVVTPGRIRERLRQARRSAFTNVAAT